MALAKKETRVAMSLKIRPSQKYFIDYAANITGKNRSEFIIESAMQCAEDTVIDQQVLHFTSDQFTAFKQALNAPIDQTALDALFAKKAPWN
ncbi:MAG: DUF1778 domain-containing protein [Candidatus Puniceispirillales bacterium WSBS_2018_MAG_OTU23]